jgi:hypothetical protein
MTIIAREAKALDRLGQLGISYEHIERALQRADAEAKLTNDLEPPTAEGVTRYNKTNRFLREELMPLGWDYDNSRNFCRTIHPERAFAIVASLGDEGTGVWIRGQNPSTKYLKGETTIRAVEANGQMTFDFGDDFVLEEEQPSSQLPVWYLLYRVTADQIFVELSFPSVIDGGRIMDWTERIILDTIDRTPGAPTTGSEPDEGDDQDYAVDVAMR